MSDEDIIPTPEAITTDRAYRQWLIDNRLLVPRNEAPDRRGERIAAWWPAGVLSLVAEKG